MNRQDKPQTLRVFGRNKKQGKKLSVVTAYDLTSALIVSAGGADAILVGDSLGMVVLGHENTLPVTLDDVLHHCKAVTRARPQIPVIADMPYGSFHISSEETVRNALRLVKEGGASAVKVEGGRQRLQTIEALLAAEIPVMGHLGLTPQSVNRLGGYRVQGRGSKAAARMVDEARLLADAGCFSLILECIPSDLAQRISEAVNIPTIGIGAGPDCDGQVLVFHDMLGLFDGLSPKFVKRYANLGEQAREAIAQYTQDVREGVFPGPEHCYTSESASTGKGLNNAAQPGSSLKHKEEKEAGYLADMENGKG
ncbi:MAG: 3-methyl-2-oxobutanoate hydroxymethyltransferase [bacterium]|nr:3-methyl-2-oxobutanoate hydroxymethyltransferase [bacterium]